MTLIKTKYIISKRGSRYLFIYPEVPYWIVVSQHGKWILEQFSVSQDLDEIRKKIVSLNPNNLNKYIELLQNLYNKLKKDGLFDFVYHERLQEFTGALDAVGLNITRMCNLRCMYCYADANLKTKNGDDEVVDIDCATKFLKEARPFISDRCFVQFTGGEPFLYPDIVFKLLDICSSLDYPAITLNTNGINMNQEIAKKLSEYKIIKNITISIDGEENIHNEIRGQGSYEKALKAIEILKENKIYTTASMTIHKKNLQYLDTFIDLCEKMDVEVFTNAMFPLGRCFKSKLDTVDISELFNKCVNSYINHDKKQKLVRGTFLSTIIMPLRDLRSKHYCGTGLSGLFMDVNGNVYPCVNTVGIKEFNAGNIRNDSLHSIWFDSENLNKIRTELDVDKCIECHDCEIRYICGGFCRGVNFKNNSQLNSPSVWCKELKKTFYEGMWTIDKYPELFKDEKDKFIKTNIQK